MTPTQAVGAALCGLAALFWITVGWLILPGLNVLFFGVCVVAAAGVAARTAARPTVPPDQWGRREDR